MSEIFLLLDSDQTGSGILFLSKARDLGLRPILVSERPEKFPWLSEFEHAKLPRMSEQSVLQLAHDLAPHRVGGVWSVRDKYAGLAARIAMAIGKQGADPKSIEICCDKLKTRQRLAQVGINNVKFTHARSGYDAARATQNFGGRAVVKPRSLTGSVGVRLCCDPDEARRHFDFLTEREPDVRQSGVVVEEAIEGLQFSAQIFDGRAIGVTRQDVGPAPAFITVGIDFPWRSDSRVHEAIVRHAEQAIEAVGHVRGPCSVDLRYDVGPRVLEINPRLAGDMIPENIRLATGIDLVEATIRFACGMTYELVPRISCGSATRWFLRPDQPVGDLTGVEEAAGVTGVVHVGLFPINYKRRGPVTDYRDRLAFVISEAGSSEEAGVIADAGVSLLKATPTTSAERGRLIKTAAENSFWHRPIKMWRRALRLSSATPRGKIDKSEVAFSNWRKLLGFGASPRVPD